MAQQFTDYNCLTRFKTPAPNLLELLIPARACLLALVLSFSFSFSCYFYDKRCGGVLVTVFPFWFRDGIFFFFVDGSLLFVIRSRLRLFLCFSTSCFALSYTPTSVV